MSDLPWPPPFKSRRRQLSPDLAQSHAEGAEPAIAQRFPSLENYFEKRANAKRFKPSEEQAAYFSWLKEGQGSAVIQAVAGAGKSTTLVQGLRHMEGNIILCAFGADAAADLKRKVCAEGLDRPGLKVGTCHSAGFGALIRACPALKDNIDKSKVASIVDELAAASPFRTSMEMVAGSITSLVSFAKQFLFGCSGSYPLINDINAWKQIIDHFSMSYDIPENIPHEQVIEWAIAALSISNARWMEKIDFDDMIYMPIWLNLRLFQNNWFIGDEWQDANPARRELAKRLFSSNGRAVFVGDDHQSIFGFTGADTDSLAVTEKMFRCEKLYLSVTYRCPKQVVKFVKDAIDPHYRIEAHPSAPEGVVRPVKYAREIAHPTIRNPNQVAAVIQPWFIQDKPGYTDALLCRYNRPLISTAYAMLRAGLPCKVEGRDIGIGLVRLAQRWKTNSLLRLEEKLKTYLKREVEKAMLANSERKAQEIEDKVESLMIFIERCKERSLHQITDLVREINSMFADKVSGVTTLCSGHKSKGREWDRVYWLETTQRGRITKEWETLNERNLRIVIGTRAISELVLVPEAVHSPPKEKK